MTEPGPTSRRTRYPREDELLLTFARTPLAPEHESRCKALLSAGLDWSYLLLRARQHGLLPLLSWHLKGCGWPSVPEPWLELLRGYPEKTAKRNLNLARELLEVLDRLHAVGIMAVPYKGPALAAACYGNIALREFSDLDILVRQQDVPAAARQLLQAGYTLRSHPEYVTAGARRIPGQYVLTPPASQTMVELHSEYTLRHFPCRPDFDAAWKRITTAPLGGKVVPSLDAEDLLLFLCVHGAKDFWERLIWVADIAQLLDVNPALDCSVALQRAREVGAERFILLGLLLARRLLAAQLPAVVGQTLLATPEVSRLAEFVEQEFIAPLAPTPSLAKRFAFRRQLAGCGYAAGLFVLPTEEDWEWIRLPEPLSFLYYGLRPLRLLATSSATREPATESGEFEPTPTEVVERMLALAGIRPGDTVYDLGCGDGRCVLLAAQKYGARAVGVEVSPKLAAEARANIRSHQMAEHVRIVQEDFHHVALREATVVLLYLPTFTNLRLRSKLQRELRPGTRIVSRGAHMGDWKPEQVETLVDASGISTTLYVWRV